MPSSIPKTNEFRFGNANSVNNTYILKNTIVKRKYGITNNSGVASVILKSIEVTKYGYNLCIKIIFHNYSMIHHLALIDTIIH